MMLMFSCVSVFAKAHSAIVSPLVMVVSVAARAVSRRRVGVNEILPLLNFFHRRHRALVSECEEVTVQGWSGRMPSGFDCCFCSCVMDCGVVMRRMMMAENMVVECMRNKNVGDIPSG